MSSIRKRAPSASTALVRRVMRNMRRRDTDAEVQLRKLIFSRGLRYRLNTFPVRTIRCKADVVIRSARVCIFVDGCYWYGCPKHYRAPKTNTSWWTEKIADNRLRDRRQTRMLRRHGWVVLRFWEHEIAGNAESCVRQIASAIRASGLAGN